MAQESVAQEPSNTTHGDEHISKGNMLGPILCWAVVFADIGTSIYYVPGILYGTVGRLAGFFVLLTMFVFILLTLKYAEVTERFPQGGGVVTVAAQAINHWVGALGGMFILVDYFLTAAISSLSGMLYLSVVIPAMSPFVLEITIVVLILLGILNWVGVSESAKVSLVGAIVAFLSDIAILVTVFSHVSVQVRSWFLPVTQPLLVLITCYWPSRVWDSSQNLCSGVTNYAVLLITLLLLSPVFQLWYSYW